MRKITVAAALVCLLLASSSHLANAQESGGGSVLDGLFGGLNWQPDALNAESEVIGNYQVVITTDPLSPRVNQTVHINFKVYNYNQGSYGEKENYAETGVNHFMMGIRVFYNDHLIDEFRPQLHEGNSWTVDYTFHRSGNHVLMVDMYDSDKNGQVVTYVFNMPVDTIFGPIFQYILVAAAAAVGGTILWVKFGMRRKKMRGSDLF